jgi:hypothetical protein
VVWQLIVLGLVRWFLIEVSHWIWSFLDSRMAAKLLQERMAESKGHRCTMGPCCLAFILSLVNLWALVRSQCFSEK